MAVGASGGRTPREGDVRTDDAGVLEIYEDGDWTKVRVSRAPLRDMIEAPGDPSDEG